MTDVIKRLAATVPVGVHVEPVAWAQRHLWIVRLLWLHVPVVATISLLSGDGALHALTEAFPLIVLAHLSTRPWCSRRVRSVVAALGLMVASAMLVHLAGGQTEVHFHFFVVLGVIALYQEWRPFLVAIAFVVAHHGVLGTMFPDAVFGDGVAQRSPLMFAGIHASYALASCAVSVVSWRIIENSNRRAMGEIEHQDRRFRSLIENSADVVTVLDADRRISYESPAAEKLLGFTPDERIGQDAFSFLHPDDARGAVETLRRSAADVASNVLLDVRVRRRDGTFIWVETSARNMLDDPSVRGIVVNFREVTQRRALQDELVHQAFHDSLTGLANRALLIDRLGHALTSASARGGRVALLYLDLDDFKIANDGLGHVAGDAILRTVAERVSSVLDPEHTASRLGGDEFAVLVEGLSDHREAWELGLKLLEAVRAPMQTEHHNEVSVSASIGIAVSAGREDATALLRNADLAMYRAKKEGKGRVEVYEAGMHADVVKRMERKADLMRGIEAAEFVPHYQPIVDLASGRVTGVEALARWDHPQRGLLSPAEFISLAEDTGMVVELGSAILRHACRDAVGWLARLGDRAPRSVSVNLSARQIQRGDVVEVVRSALQDSGLPPQALTLEVTESVLLEDVDHAVRTLAALKALGVRMALDDFGTGYSSLSYLDRFPVDIVKIDKTFIDSLAGTSQPSPLVSAIVNLGTMLGLDVTAEGIEDEVQLARLREMGCTTGQGFYFARPMARAELESMLRPNLRVVSVVA